jgi:hypothetical protein
MPGSSTNRDAENWESVRSVNASNETAKVSVAPTIISTSTFIGVDIAA